LLDGLALDLLSSLEDSRATSEVHVGGREIVRAFRISAVIVVLDEIGDGAFEIARQIIVL
jgi:hypothetical protein